MKLKGMLGLAAALSFTAGAWAQSPGPQVFDSGSAAASTHHTNAKRIRINYYNLTAGQPFSPSAFFSHNKAAPPFFVEGKPAPFGLQRIAEEGNTGPLLTLQVVKTLGGAFGYATQAVSVEPGKSTSVVVEVTAEHPLITGVWMLANTNDGFTGIDSVDAYNLTGTKEYQLFAWDAGTENNNELGDFLPSMEGTARDPENGTIQRHTGLRGDADAPGFWKFDPNRPVGYLTIAPAQ